MPSFEPLAHGCPVCRAPLRNHSQPSADDYEEWWYACGCILHDHEGKLHAEHACPEPTHQAIDKLAAVRPSGRAEHGERIPKPTDEQNDG